MATSGGSSIFISFLGVIVVVGGDINDINGQMLFGVLCCVLGAVSYGIFTALNKKMNYNKSMTLMVSYFATFIFTTLVNLYNGNIFIPGINQMIGFVWNGVFTVAIANTFWIMALETGKTEKVSNLAYITPFLSLVWTYLFLNEEIKLNSLLGLIIIVFGIVIQLKEKK